MARKQLVEDALEQPGEALHVRYRPKSLSSVIGQTPVVNSIKAALSSPNRAHAYLFTGPSGCGKTTLARIVAKELGVSPQNVLEVDAATNTGIDAMRAITDTLNYKGFGDSPLKMVVIDEAHALSKAAWQSILKVIEEPPAHVFFALCTTEVGKVPETVQTRCLRYALASVHKDALWDLAERVANEEGYDTPDDVLDLVVKAADGSPRRLLTALAAAFDCKSAKEAAAVLSQPLETPEVIELCRLIVSRGLRDWEQVTAVLAPLRDEDPEGVRLIVINYITAVLLNTKKQSQVDYLLGALSEFMRPINRSEKMAPLLIAFGNLLPEASR